MVEESQSSSFASERAVADSCKVAVCVKLFAAENSYGTEVLHVAVLHDGVKDNLSVGIDILQFLQGHRFQKLRYGEYGSCAKPAAHMVS